MTFWALLLQVIPLGIAAAFTPSLLAMQVLIVSDDPWRLRALSVATGGAAAFLLVGLLVFFGFVQLPTMGSVRDDPLGAALRIVAGIVLIGLCAWFLRPHPALQAKATRDVEGYVAHASPWVFVGIAFALSIKDVSSFVVLIPALHDIAVSGLAWPEQAGLLVVLYALALSPVLVPPLLRLAFGHRLDPGFARVYRFTMDHQFVLVGLMAAVIGLYLVISGLLRWLA